MKIRIGSLLDFLPELSTVRQGLNIATRVSNAVTPGARKAPMQRRQIVRRPQQQKVRAVSPMALRSAPQAPQGKPDDKTMLYVVAGVAVIGAGIFFISNNSKRKK